MSNLAAFKRTVNGVVLGPTQHPTLPKSCRCDKPVYITDERNHTNCFLCGKAPNK